MENLEKELKQIFKERGLEGRDYQIRNILNYTNPQKPHVTAVGTAGGKTILDAARFELYYKCGLIKQNEKVVIIPADKTILRGNFKGQFDKFKPTCFTYSVVEDKIQLIEAIENNIQVIIGLPQLLKDHTKLLKNVKWLVLDEAHKWYFAPTIKGIIKDLTPKKGVLHQSLLTGTPFKFNRYKNNFIIDYTSVSTLYKQGYADDVNMQVLHTSLALTRLDWSSMTGNLREDKKFTKKEINNTLSEMILQLVKKVKLPIKDLSSVHNITNNMASKLFGKLQKTIIFTHRTDAANVVAEYLRLQGVKCIVSHSNIDGEIAEESFSEFRKDDNIKVLVSVNRGKEGFDFPELYNIIDMTYSQNFEVVMQMIGRLLRPSHKKTYKVFYKIAPKNTEGYFTDWMDCLIQLFDDKWYQDFNGRNMLDVTVPNALLSRPKGEKQPTYIQDGKNKIEIVSGTSLTKGTKIQIMKDGKKTPLKDGTYKIPQTPTTENPKPLPIEIEVKNGIITKTPVRTTRGRFRPKVLNDMGFDLSISFMEKNDWFRLEDPLSTVATTSLRKIILQLENSYRYKHVSKIKDELFYSYDEAKQFVKTLNLKSNIDWRNYSMSDSFNKNLPLSPDHIYKNNGWISWGDFLGTGIVSNLNRQYKTFEDAKTFIHSLGFTKQSEWREYSASGKRPLDIPGNPEKIYSEWKNIGDWLGTNSIGNKEKSKNYISYEDAKEFAIKLNLKNRNEWDNLYKQGIIPSNIPKNPSQSYIDKGWISWSEFLNNGFIDSKNKMTYQEAKLFIQKLNLKNTKEWKDYCDSGNKPNTIPKSPQNVYDEWEGWGSFLGNGKLKGNYRPFKIARKFVHSLQIKNTMEWFEYCKSGKKPFDIPTNPNNCKEYKNDWINWCDWLGNGETPKPFKGRKKK